MQKIILDKESKTRGTDKAFLESKHDFFWLHIILFYIIEIVHVFFQIMQCHIKKYVIGSKLYDMKESYNVNINIIYYLFHPRNVCSQQKSQNFKNQFQIPTLY